MELFGWQGFAFKHREDWCPDLLSGNRHSGLIRLTGPGGQLQVKWQTNRRAPNLISILRGYIRHLERHCRKTSLQFAFETSGGEDSPRYTWKSGIYGCGLLQYDGISRRSFIIEASAPKRDVAATALEVASKSFIAFGKDREIWSVNGLRVTLPSPAELKSWKLVSGRTQLNFIGPRVVLTAGRSAFALELLAGLSLRDWASKLAGGGSVQEDGAGLRIESVRRRWGMTIASTTLVRLDKASNELKYISVMRRNEGWRPDWTWLE